MMDGFVNGALLTLPVIFLITRKLREIKVF
jgi:hypothetical protein